MIGTLGVHDTHELPWITEGVHEVKIQEIRGNNNGEYISFTFSKLNSEGDTTGDSTKTIRLYYKGKARDITLQKIAHIGANVIKRRILDAIQAEDLESYAFKLNEVLANKTVRIKFIGEQYIDQNGFVKIVLKLGLPPFAEPLENDAEYPVVPRELSKLKFDYNNIYDFKRVDTKSEEAPF